MIGVVIYILVFTVILIVIGAGGATTGALNLVALGLMAFILMGGLVTLLVRRARTTRESDVPSLTPPPPPPPVQPSDTKMPTPHPRPQHME